MHSKLFVGLVNSLFIIYLLREFFVFVNHRVFNNQYLYVVNISYLAPYFFARLTEIVIALFFQLSELVKQEMKKSKTKKKKKGPRLSGAKTEL